MRIPWPKSKVEQLDLIEDESSSASAGLVADTAEQAPHAETCVARSSLSIEALRSEGVPLQVPLDSLVEDPGNPRTDFPDAEIAELAEDIALRGILQPIVVRRPDDDGRYRVLFGAKRLRAAKKARLEVVPIVIGAEAHDAYAQVAENQKRHGLTSLDLARFIRARVDAGESNADIARRMGMDLTSVAHHLALLTLPAELDEAFRSGRCTSPRTLYELAKLQKTKPERVKAIVNREGGITRNAVASLKKASRRSRAPSKTVASRRQTSLVAQANDLCTRLESLLGRMTRPGSAVTTDEMAALRRRMARLGSE